MEIPGVSSYLIVSGAEGFNHASPDAKIKPDESNWFVKNFQQLHGDDIKNESATATIVTIAIQLTTYIYLSNLLQLISPGTMVAPHPPPVARHRAAGRPGRRGRSAAAVAPPGDRRGRWPHGSSSEDLAVETDVASNGSKDFQSQGLVQNDGPKCWGTCCSWDSISVFMAKPLSKWNEPEFPYHRRTIGTS